MIFSPPTHAAGGPSADAHTHPHYETVLVAVLLAGVAVVLGAVVALAMAVDVAALMIAVAVLVIASGFVMATVYAVLRDEEANDDEA